MRRNRRLAVIAAGVTLLGSATWLASAVPGTTAGRTDVHTSADATKSASGALGTPYVHTRPKDDAMPGADGTVTLRSCPLGGADKPLGQNPWSLDCIALERLGNGTTVAMRCWASTTPPPDEASAKWFKVEVTSGPQSGKTGWVWSDLVRDQTPGTAQCDHIGHEKDPAAPAPEPLHFEVTGSCTTEGGELASRSGRFTPGGPYSVDATRPDGSAYPLAHDSGTVRADGSVVWKWPCKGDPVGTYTTHLVDLSTGREAEDTFTVGQAPAPSGGDSPGGDTSSGGGTSPGSGSDESGDARPGTPASRTVTVSNKVTNGPSEMREDDSAAYLSSVTKNHCADDHCADDHCALAGTELHTGDTVAATCRTEGDRTTNGEDRNARDDGNPGLAESTLWYGVRWTDGRFGYLSVVWIRPDQRGGLGLPSC
ncbi:hypothetical protein [Streptomyces sp. NPDC096012]|uniref:hypothetical protein n=1 Tax=Streptomyces sp. NPDC096012 TaxID=3155684 RepID=UPI00336A7F3F